MTLRTEVGFSKLVNAQLISELHEIACHDERRDLLLAMAELCFLTAHKADANLSQQTLDNQEFYYSPIDPCLYTMPNQSPPARSPPSRGLLQ